VDSFQSWTTQLRKGVVELLVLRLLASRGETYGYRILAELREAGDLVAGESTVYPLLRRLQDDGLVKATWSTEAGGNPRKNYLITDEGRAFLERAAVEWAALERAMHELGGEDRDGD
jgi:PadR family transcriptional regulator PadR